MSAELIDQYVREMVDGPFQSYHEFPTANHRLQFDEDFRDKVNETFDQLTSQEQAEAVRRIRERWGL